MLQGIFLSPLKPSHAVALENQLHKPPEKQGQVVRRLSYGNYSDAANLSKPSVLVNRKMPGNVPIGATQQYRRFLPGMI